ncbi:MAG: bifunctional folylpolyglutamate synthase/dihydrofolate synthase [Verrucomicrobia bacterium]|nr:bifunctional folylpolyglutamate synthase/dihydrofolate synthase [Verrucomicrobiota bacterium]
MDADATIRWLTGLRNLGSRLGVERMRALSDRLGRPELAAPCFHVAGTNGKGSTCAMIEAVQRAHGRLTGLYTSPHLVSVGERIRVGRQAVTEARVAELAEALRPHHDALAAQDADLAPTFFELITAAALLEFRERRTEVNILETGLGGRLDATNVCVPEVTVITSIGLDHQEFLGPTYADIAREKAGIIKPGAPCVMADLPPEAEAAVQARAAEVGAPLHLVRERFRDGLPECGMAGDHQRRNAGAALLACELAARLPVRDDVAREALRSVTWEGRWQRLPLGDSRVLVVDGAHNEEGARAAEALLAGLGSPTVILGALGAARARPLVEAAARHAGRLIFVRADDERACDPAELLALVPAAFRGEASVARTADLFPASGRCAAPGEAVVVLGSLYLVGEVIARHSGRRRDALQDRLNAPR